MSPFTPMVLGAAALVTSPALWAAVVEQSMSLDQALVRYLVAVAICWGLLSLLAEFALKPAPPRPAEDQQAGTTTMDVADSGPLAS